MNNKKLFCGILFCLFFFSLVFAEVIETSTIAQQAFYMPSVSSTERVLTGLHFENTMKVSTSSSNIISGDSDDLEDGDMVCPGTVTTSSIIDGQYAYGYWSAYAFAPDPNEEEQNDPSNYDSWSGSPDYNLPIFFSSINYDALDADSDERRYVYKNGGVGSEYWHDWFTLDDQKLKRLELFDGEEYFFTYDKKAKTNMICKAKVEFYRDGARRSTEYVDILSEESYSFYLNEGNYTFQTKLEIEGCAIPVEPTGDLSSTNQYKFLFSRTSAGFGPEYTYNQDMTDSINIEVMEPYLSFRVNSYQNEDGLWPPFCFGPDGDELVEIVNVRIRNNGPVDAFVTDASISPEGWSLDEDMLELLVIGQEIEAGSTETLRFMIVYDGSTIDDRDLQLEINFRSTEEICGEYLEESVYVPISHNDCEDPVYYCTITPEAITATVGEDLDFDMVCHDGEDYIDCDVIDWDLDSADDWDFSWDDEEAEVGVNSEGEGTLTVEATYEGVPITCDAEITVNPLPCYCELDPSEDLDMIVGDTYGFSLHCYDPVTDPPTEVPCVGPDFWLDPDDWTIEDSWIPFFDKLVTPTSIGDATLNAFAICNDIQVNCDADLHADERGEGEQTYCLIIPAENFGMDVGTEYTFHFGGCFDLSGPIDCDPDWSLVPAAWDLTPSDTMAKVTPNFIGGGILTATAHSDAYPDPIVCTADLLARPDEGGDQYYCTIEPPEYFEIVVGDHYEFDGHCYNLTEEVDCESPSWAIDPVPWTLDSTDTHAKVTPISDEDGTITMNAEYGGFPLVCTAELSTLPEGADQYYCEIEPPAYFDIETGVDYDFEAHCYNASGVDPVEVDCQSPVWTLNPGAWTLDSLLSEATVTPTTDEDGALDFNAEYEGFPLLCNALLSTEPFGTQYYCELEPPIYLGIELGSDYDIFSHCYDATGAVPVEVECEEEEWSVDPAEWELTEPPPVVDPPYDMLVTVTSEEDGTVTLNAEYGGYPLVCNTDFSTEEEGNFCVLTTPDAGAGYVHEATEVDVYIECNEEDVIVDCTEVTWEVDGGEVSSSDDSSLVALVSEEDHVFEVTATVHEGTDAEYECDLLFNINHGESCIIRVVSLYPEGFGTFEYNVTCYDGLAVDCTDIGELNWIVAIEDLAHPMHYDWTEDDVEQSVMIEVRDYLSAITDQKEMEITATINPSDPDEDSLVCTLNTMLPSMYCEIFI